MSFHSITLLLVTQKRSVLAEEYPNASVGLWGGFHSRWM